MGTHNIRFCEENGKLSLNYHQIPTLSVLLLIQIFKYLMSHVIRKPIYAICEQQRRRSACMSAQSDNPCYSLPG